MTQTAKETQAAYREVFASDLDNGADYLEAKARGGTQPGRFAPIGRILREIERAEASLAVSV